MEAIRKLEKSKGLNKERISVGLNTIRELSADDLVDRLNLLHAAQHSAQSSLAFREIIDALPVAIYTTDAEGRLTHFNRAAIDLAGRVPELGTDRWCVTLKLYYPDGKHLPHDQCPMAVCLRDRRAIRDAEAIAERPDGTRVWFQPYPTPLFDESGDLIGGLILLVDITDLK
jgi:PAS domain S-box-containing protein